MPTLCSPSPSHCGMNWPLGAWRRRASLGIPTASTHLQSRLDIDCGTEFGSRRLNASEGDYIIMFVGTFGVWHGAEIFARAVLIASDDPWMREMRVKFAFVGDGKTKRQCEEILAAVPSLAGRCIFTGLVPQHETPKYLAAADAFVASHSKRGWVEVLWVIANFSSTWPCQRPIVASALDQIASVLSHERTAILVRPWRRRVSGGRPAEGCRGSCARGAHRGCGTCGGHRKVHVETAC